MLRTSIFITFLLLSFVSWSQQKMMDHSHIPIDVPSNAPTPRLSLELSRDVMSGFNLTLKLSHYQFTVPPANMSMQEMMSVGQLSRQGYLQGHAHLYINGEKIQRIYGQYVHLPQELFKNGINNISVTLNNHGHMYWLADTKKILATLTINPNNDKFLVHDFASFPLKN